MHTLWAARRNTVDVAWHKTGTNVPVLFFLFRFLPARDAPVAIPVRGSRTRSEFSNNAYAALAFRTRAGCFAMIVRGGGGGVETDFLRLPRLAAVIGSKSMDGSGTGAVAGLRTRLRVEGSGAGLVSITGSGSAVLVRFARGLDWLGSAGPGDGTSV